MSQILRLPPAADTIDPTAQDDVFSGAKPFQYHSLSTSEPEIRLFGLRGRGFSSGDLGYQLNCELFHVRISELPPYAALSYTWGEVSDPRHSILINGQDFKVRDNLWQALVHLQPEHQNRLIWIDAICINQEDVHERNEQVRMMRTIYQTAELVIAWLGLEDGASHRAILFLKSLDKCGDDEQLALKLFKQPHIGEDLKALVWFYDRSYWHRVWIVQEIVLANAIWVHCGKDIVPWRAFESARKWICKSHIRSELVRLCVSAITEPWFRNLRSNTHGAMLIDETREQFRQRELGFLETASVNGSREASDPRDLVYEILGIVSVKASVDIEPDYTKSVARVYSDFAKFIVLESKQLDILLVVYNKGSNVEGLPSWVPDWTKGTKGHRCLHNHEMLRRLRLRWEASGLTPSQCSFDGEDGSLVFSGLNIGHISKTRASKYKNGQDTPEHIVDTFFDWLDMIENIKGDIYENTLAFSEVLSEGAYSSTQKLRPELGAFIGAFVRAAAENSTHLIDQRLKEYLRQNDELFQTKAEVDVWNELRLARAANVTWNRCLFVSSSGSIGLGPGTVVEGDILCVPLGCISPVVLRPCEGYHTLVGETYMHGFMHGEAIKLLEEGRLTLEKFEIH